MSFKTLLEPITDSGIKNTNFFEGRLLSGKDLSEQEVANKRHRQQLGKILGHGVVEGLEVSIENIGAGTDDPVVRVSKGMAITLDGEVVELPIDYVDIKLSRTLVSSDASTAVFKDCNDISSEILVHSGAGLYILVMSPAGAYREYAPKSGLQKKGVAQNCGRGYWVEGVKFRLVHFDPIGMPDIFQATKDSLQNEVLNPGNPILPDDYQNLSKLQNMVAHICFGTEASRLSQTNVLETVANPVRGIDALLGDSLGLESCDLPIGMIYWTLDGIGFVDNWAVKRKYIHK